MLICTLTVPHDSSGMSCPKGLKRNSFDFGTIVVVCLGSVWSMTMQQLLLPKAYAAGNLRLAKNPSWSHALVLLRQEQAPAEFEL